MNNTLKFLADYPHDTIALPTLVQNCKVSKEEVQAIKKKAFQHKVGRMQWDMVKISDALHCIQSLQSKPKTTAKKETPSDETPSEKPKPAAKKPRTRVKRVTKSDDKPSK